MRPFFEEYGIGIFVVAVITILVLMSTPVGKGVKSSVTAKINQTAGEDELAKDNADLSRKMDAKGGNIDANRTIKYGDSLPTADEMHKEGSEFLGWEDDDGNSADTFEQGKHYIAIWDTLSYSLVIKNTGGSDKKVTLETDQTLNLGDLGLNREGCELVGFSKSLKGDIEYTKNQIVKNLSSVRDDTVTLYARWKAPRGIMVGEELYLTYTADELVVGDTYKGKTITSIHIIPKNNTESDGILWDLKNTHKIVVEESFKDFQPESLAYWFRDVPDELTATGFENIDTSKVTNMQGLFSHSGISSGGLFGGSTLVFKVEGMDNWDTSKVTNMAVMFTGAGYLAGDWSIGDLSKWDTSNVTNMTGMFSSTSGEATNWGVGDISNWDVKKVTSTQNMFYGLYGVDTIDLSGWNTKSLTNTENMFSSCTDLVTIYVGDDWDITSSTNSNNMFSGSTNLVGQDGTTYDSSKLDKEYAVIDGRKEKKGYLSSKDDLKAVAVKGSDGVLTFYYDMKDHTSEGDVYEVPENAKKADDITWSEAFIEGKATYKYSYSGPYESWYPDEDPELTQLTGDDLFDGDEDPLYYIAQDIYQDEYSGKAWYGGVITYDINSTLASYGSFFWDFDSTTKVLTLKKTTSAKIKIDKTFKNFKPSSTAYWFTGMKDVEHSGLENINTSKVTNMSYMFKDFGYTSCNNPSLNISKWDTSKVTNMSHMFDNFCNNLISKSLTLDFSSWDTSNVVDASYMFYMLACQSYDGDGCSITLDVSNFGGNSLKTTSHMFDTCFSFVSSSYDYLKFDISNFKTNNVEDMSYMFSNSLVEPYSFAKSFDSEERVINFPSFDTSNVKDMSYMFSCFCRFSGYPFTLDLSNFDTSNVTNMNHMFYCCLSNCMVDLILGENFNTENVTDMSYMFSNTFVEVSNEFCNVRTLDLRSFNTSKVKTMKGMFEGVASCGSCIEYIDLSNWDTSNVTDMSYMFNGCSSQGGILTSVLLTNWDTRNVTDMSYMFAGLGGFNEFISLDITSFNTSNVVNMDSMFYHKAEWSTWNNPNMTLLWNKDTFITSKVVNMQRMFYSVATYNHLDFSNFYTPNVKNMSGMFYGLGTYDVSSPYILDFSHFNTKNLEEAEDFLDVGAGVEGFYDDYTVLLIIGDNWDPSKITYMYGLTGACGSTSDDLDCWDNTYFKAETKESPGFLSEKEYTITLNTNGGPSLENNKVIHTTSDYSTYSKTGLPGVFYQHEFPQDLKNGDKTLIGWSTESDGSGLIMDTLKVSSTNQTLYAVWSDDIKPTALRKSDGSLTFYYDNNDRSSQGEVYYVQKDSKGISDVPWYKDKGSITSVSFDSSFANFISLRSMAYWFYDFENLTSINLENLKTNRVTSLSNTFNGCKSLSTLDLTPLNYNSLIDMSYAFKDLGYNNMVSLDLSMLKASYVTNMEHMLENCGYCNLTSINLDGIDTSKVTNMSCMFKNFGHDSLASLDLSELYLNKVVDMSYFLNGCGYNKLSNFTAFKNAYSLENAEGLYKDFGYETTGGEFFSNVNFKKVKNAKYMYSGIYHGNLTYLYFYSSFNSIEDSSYMFANCDLLEGLAFDVTNGSTILKAEGMFENCTNLKGICVWGSWNLPSEAVCTNMFKGCVNLAGGMGTKCDGVTNIGKERACIDLRDTPGYFSSKEYRVCFDTDGNGRAVYYYGNYAEQRFYKDNYTPGIFSNLSNYYSKFEREGYIVIGFSEESGSNIVVPKEYKPKTVSSDRLYTVWEEARKVVITSAGDMIFYNDNLDHSSEGTVYNIPTGATGTSSIPWYSSASKVKTVRFDESFKTYDRVTSTSYWFYNFTNATSFDFTNFNSSNVKSMSYMFYGCSCTAINFSTLDTSNVVSMKGFLSACSSVNTVDFSLLNTSKVNNMSYMFAQCSSTTYSLDLSNLDTSSVVYMNNMFYSCTTMKSIDLSGFDTSHVTDISYMFYKCNSLETLNVSSFDTRKVTTMYETFYYCNSLKTLDISSFRSDSLTDLTYCFYNCFKLQTIYADKTFKVGSGYTYVFYNCSYLVGGAGCTYSSSKGTYQYARVDTGFQPGLFTAKNYTVTLKDQDDSTIQTVLHTDDKTTWGTSTSPAVFKIADLPTPTKEGKTFKGWSKNKGGSTIITDTSYLIFTVDEDVLYAVW